MLLNKNIKWSKTLVKVRFHLTKKESNFCQVVQESKKNKVNKFNRVLYVLFLTIINPKKIL